MLKQLKKLWHDDSGATSIEYAMIALLIGVAIIPALGTLAPKITATFGKVQTGL